MRTFLLQCIEIEETIAKIYRQLATKSGIDAELRALLEKLANDEDGHASQLRLASRLLNENVFAGIKFPRERLAESLKRARSFLQQVQTEQLGVQATVALAMRLEKDFSDVHAHCAVDFADTKMAEMFRSLASEDKRHANAINVFLESRRGARG